MTDGGRQKVGLWGAVAIGIGGMVGGGIFAVLGVVATEAAGAAPVAFLIAGGVALVTAASYARLTARYPSRGGSVVFIDRAFGVGLLTGVLNNVLWFGYLVTLALYAVAFANYGEALLGVATPAPAVAHHLLVSAAIVVPTALNLLSAAKVAETETAIVALKILMLVVVVGSGLTAADPSALSPGTWPSFPAIAAAGMLVFVAYEGFELIANAGEDAKDPVRTLPRALYISVVLVIVIYVAVAVVTVSALSPAEIAQSSDFALAEAAKPSLGEIGFMLVAVSALLATFSAINATLYGTARLSYSIAMERELPPALEKRVWTQPVGLMITAAASLTLANTLDVTEISSIASAVFLMVFAAVNAAALRVCRAPAGRAVSGLGVVACAASLTILVADTAGKAPVAMVVMATMLILSVLGEALWLRHRRHLRLDGAELTQDAAGA